MIKAAFAKIDYTPEPGQRFGRLGVNILIAEGTMWPLYARIGVFDDGGERSAVCVLDQGILLSPVVSEIRRAISGEAGIKPGNIMVAATHTHNAPPSWPWMPEDPGYKFIDEVCGKIQAVTRDAMAALAPAHLRIGRIDASGWCFNRRPLYRGEDDRRHAGTHGPRGGDNYLGMEGPEDNQLLVLAATDKEGRPLGGLINFACHPTTMYGSALFSADFPGPLCSELERFFDGTFIFANGCCGNLSPGSEYEGGQAHAEKMGGALAAKAVEALEGGRDLEEGKIRVAREVLSIQQRRPTVEQIETARRFLESGLETDDPGAFARTMYGHDYHFHHNQRGISEWLARETLGMWEWQRRVGTREFVEDVEVQVIGVDDFAMVGLPGELFCEFGLHIKRESPFPDTFVIELANGWHGYIPTEEAFEHGGYETCFAMQSRMVPEAGRLMTETAVRLLEKIS